jgi:transmembrane sensor
MKNWRKLTGGKTLQKCHIFKTRRIFMERLDYILSLIIRELDGNITFAERLDLAQWLAEKPDNPILYRKITEVWASGGKEKYESEKMNALDKIMEILDLKDAGHMPQPDSVDGKRSGTGIARRILSGWYKYAATFAGLILLSVFLVWLHAGGVIRIETTHDQTEKIILPDGSEVMLNGSSVLHYSFNRLKSGTREVYLEGEAYFTIEPSPDRNFRVLTSCLEITALGTSFNVKSYSDDYYVETTLVEGKVIISRNTPNGINELLQVALEPNHKAVFLKKEEKIIVSEVDVVYPTAWTRGDLIFRDESLKEIINVLSRRFNVHIETKGERLDSFAVTADLTGNTLKQNLDLLCLLIEARYTLENNIIIIEE